MPIRKKTAYIAICDKCGDDANPEWTRFDREELLEDLCGGAGDLGLHYNEKTGEIYCWRCLEKYPFLWRKTNEIKSKNPA